MMKARDTARNDMPVARSAVALGKSRYRSNLVSQVAARCDDQIHAQDEQIASVPNVRSIGTEAQQLQIVSVLPLRSACDDAGLGNLQRRLMRRRIWPRLALAAAVTRYSSDSGMMACQCPQEHDNPPPTHTSLPAEGLQHDVGNLARGKLSEHSPQ